MSSCGGASASNRPPAEPDASPDQESEHEHQHDTQATKAPKKGGLGLMWGRRIDMRNPKNGDPVGPPHAQLHLSPGILKVEGRERISLTGNSKARSQMDEIFVRSRDEFLKKEELPLYALSVDDSVDSHTFKLATYWLATAGWPDARLSLGDQNQRVELRVALPGMPVTDPNLIPPELRWSKESLAIFVQANRTILYGRSMVFDHQNESNIPAPKTLAEIPTDARPEALRLAFQRACKVVSCSPSALFMSDDVSLGRVRNLLKALVASTKKAGSYYVELRFEKPASNLLTKMSSPRAGLATTTVNGRLPADVIRKVVRENHGRSRACYEAGLERDPDLTGKLRIRFVIARDGAVSAVADATDEMPDAQVKACVLGVFRSLHFPKPKGGIVTVTYPLVFSSQ